MHGVEGPGVDGGLLGTGGSQGAEVIGRLESGEPGHFVGQVKLLARSPFDVEVQGLRLVKPLLAARGSLHQPLGFHFEGSGKELLQVLGHALDGLQRTIVVLQVIDHDSIPEPFGFQCLHQVGVDHGELPGEVRFHVEVLVGRFDGLTHPDDIGDGGGGRDGHDIGITLNP